MLEQRQLAHSGKNNFVCCQKRGIEQQTQLRFWEIDHFFICPTVGLCLSLSEQKQLLKRAGLSAKKKSSFEIHETIVASAESENRLSRRIDNLLCRKFGNEMDCLIGLEQKAFMVRWQAAFKAGDCIGIFWVAASRPDLSFENKREIFGAVHMAMHGNSEQYLKMRQALRKQQEAFSAMHQGMKEAVQAGRMLKKENEHLRRKQEDLNARLAFAEKEKIKIEDKLVASEIQQRLFDLEQENRRLKEKLTVQFENDRESNRRAALLKKQNEQLSAELERQRELNLRLNEEAQKIIGEVFSLNNCDENCPSFDLCKKRILIVGGITRMESLYRQLVEGSGGIFEYHDGYMKKGGKRLECRLMRADMVLCPVSCNSHAACSVVKNLAKKHNKPVHMLANSSLTSVSRVIRGAAVTRAGINSSQC